MNGENVVVAGFKQEDASDEDDETSPSFVIVIFNATNEDQLEARLEELQGYEE